MFLRMINALLKNDKNALVWLLVLFVLHFFCACISLFPNILKYKPNEVRLEQRLKPPGKNHILGTDEFGRDMFCRIAGGVKVSLAIGLLSIAISLLVGVVIGMIAGYYGGILDTFIVRFIETFLAFPNLFLVMVIVALLGSTPLILVLTIGFSAWFKVAILTRTKFKSLVERDFVLAAKALGASDRKVIFSYILPNILPHIMVAATYGVGNAILTECTLSYLGVGIQEPIPSLGNMLYSGKKFILRGEFFWVSFYPGLAVLLILLGYNFLGDGLARLMTPNLNTRKYSHTTDNNI